MKRILSFLKTNILFYLALVTALFFCMNFLLNSFNLEYRQWVYYAFATIVVLGVIVGIFQLIKKFKNAILKNICSIFLILLIIISLPISMLVVMVYSPEEIVTKDDYKLVAYEDKFLFDSTTRYYDYVNWFICGKQQRLVEDYQDGDLHDYIWYDDNGNAILSNNAQD